MPAGPGGRAHETCAYGIRMTSEIGHRARTFAAVRWERVEPESYAAGAKRPTNLSVRGDLIAAARAARINLSALLERALTEELVRLKWWQWREENGPAVAAYNRHVRENGAFCRIGLRWGCRSTPFT